MRAILAPLILALAFAGPAAAQTPALLQASRFDPAPWWMDQPVIASVGHVETEVQANRATFTATFTAVEKTAAEATQKAANQLQALGQTLAALGTDKVVTQISLTTQPLYEQYRDKEGNRVDNERADRIVQYQVDGAISVEIRDITLLQVVVNAVIAAQPTYAGQIDFRVEPSNQTLTEMARQATLDAARRARDSAEAAGARLGPVKLIDPTGRACQTDVLVTGAPRSYGPSVPAMVVGGGSQYINTIPTEVLQQVQILKNSRSSYGSDAVAGVVNFITLRSSSLISNLPVQPPFEKLSAVACVVYALG